MSILYIYGSLLGGLYAGYSLRNRNHWGYFAGLLIGGLSCALAIRAAG